MPDYLNETTDDASLLSAGAGTYRPGDSYRVDTPRPYATGQITPAGPGPQLPSIPGAIPVVRTEQSPPEFVHLQTALESRILDFDMPSSVSISGVAEEGLSQDRPYVLGISSAVQGEGKTTTAMHLALTMAMNSYKRICLMDFSLAQHLEDDLAFRFGLYATRGTRADGSGKPAGPTRGIVDVLEETSAAVSTFQMSDPDNLTIVPGGRVASRPARSARSPRIPQLISSARHVFDVIIVDLPAVTTEYAVPITRYMDGVMLVVQSGATPRNMVQQAIEVIGQEKVVGVALNRYKTAVPSWLMKKLRL